MRREQNLKEKARKIAGLGRIFIFGGLICAIVSLMYWQADREERRLAEQQENATKLDKSVDHVIDPAPPTPAPAIVDSWYKGEQMVPSKELGEDSDWQIAVYGDVSEQGLEDSTVESRNLIDSELANSLSALFMTEDDDGQRRSFDDYIEEPVIIEPGKYQIEFDCTRYNLSLPVDQKTMKYFIVPTRLRGDSERAITFALYDDENRQFHQICVPFRSEKFVVIKYALDDVFVEETWGQVYRLCFEVTETSPWPDSNPQ